MTYHIVSQLNNCRTCVNSSIVSNRLCKFGSGSSSRVHKYLVRLEKRTIAGVVLAWFVGQEWFHRYANLLPKDAIHIDCSLPLGWLRWRENVAQVVVLVRKLCWYRQLTELRMQKYICVVSEGRKQHQHLVAPTFVAVICL